MALFHLSVTQTKRSAGQSAIASAAYRAGERLYSEYYGEYSDYTRKGGVICSDILLPSHAPPEYADRQTLWNAVEKAERGKNAQLAYSFDIALQNEFPLEENIALARQFLLENFVSRGMVVDFAVHQPDREDGGIPNPHFHVLCPIRPIEQNGKWGLKQRRVYELDEDGNRIRDQNGEFVFNAVPTTDWGSPETLEHWREAWAEMCNAKFAEKGIDVRIDHRSYERQGVDLLPTIHEGATVRAMEKKGIRTEKGEFNRWIKATNAVIRDIKKKIALLFDWIAEAKAEIAKPQAPDLVSLLNAYYTQRKAGAYSQKGKISNLKEMNDTFNYLRENGIYSLEDLEHRVSEHSAATESLKKTLDEQTARMKAIKQLYDSSAAFQSLKPVYDGLQKIKFEKPRAKYKAEHEAELKQFYAARRKLTGEFPDGKVDKDKCTGCGACANICPKHVIMIDAGGPRKPVVMCSNQDKGPVAMKACTTSCIACGMCERTCKFDAIHVVDGVARVDYDKCKGCGMCAQKCPKKIILFPLKDNPYPPEPKKPAAPAAKPAAAPAAAPKAEEKPAAEKAE